MNLIIVQTAFWLATLGSAQPVDTQALIEQALQEPTKIALDNVKLIEAVRILSEQTGVKIVMPQDVMNRVPGGPDMLIEKVDIANIPLREGLNKLFGPLGMTFVVSDDHVRITPKEALLCLGRPPTWTELDLLSEVSSLQPGVNGPDREKLLSRVQMQAGWSIAGLRVGLENVGAGAGDEVLTIACNAQGMDWCLSDKTIVVESIQRRVQRLLENPVTLRLNNRPLFDVLTAVGEQAGVAVRAEPGALASLPLALQQSFSLTAQRQPAEQVLEKIAAFTGLGYLLGPEGVVFYQPANRPQGSAEAESAAPPPPSNDPYVAKVVIPLEDGKTVEWLIRASQLPPDLREMRERDLQDLFDTLRRRAASPSP